MEATAGWRIYVFGNAPRYSLGDSSAGELGECVHKPMSVWMKWIGEQLLLASPFDDVSCVHYINPIGHLANNAEAVRDEDD